MTAKQGCGYPGCEAEIAHRPYARARDGIPSASTVAELLDDGKARSFAWSASLIAAATAVHAPDAYQGLIGVMTDKAAKAGHEECTQTKDGLCKACQYLRSEFDRQWTTKANLGTHLHHLALSWAKGEEVDEDPVTKPYLDALEQFYLDCRPEFHHLETTVLYDRTPGLSYRGQFDFIATLTRDGERRKGLWDIKTGSFYPVSQTLQLAGYRAATWVTDWSDGKETKVEKMPPVSEAGVLLLQGDGTYRLIALPADGEAHSSFLRLRDLFRWSRQVKKWAAELETEQEQGEAA